MPSVSGDTDADRGAIAELLDEHPEITAFVAAEYQFAVLVHEVLASLGRLDGRTIACFDMPDVPFAPHDFLHVRQDERAMGMAGRQPPCRASGGRRRTSRLDHPRRDSGPYY